mmetsp:Transcript_63323/g.131246  ORF Transcript_63323/g.131246 Transcript_63323/m.131246 type:complete len:84 (-) Transcript_63323:411-662(-)
MPSEKVPCRCWKCYNPSTNLVTSPRIMGTKADCFASKHPTRFYEFSCGSSCIIESNSRPVQTVHQQKSQWSQQQRIVFFESCF